MFSSMTPTLIRSMTVFVIMLVISTAVVTASYIYMDDIFSQQQTAKRAMLIWKKKIDDSVANNQIIDQFEKNFLKLVNQGVVGKEDRVSWFETLQATAKKRGMPSVKYSISTQQQLEQRNLKREYQGIDVFKSVMTLEIRMAHEGDLFALINDLRQADGLFTIDMCNIEKIGRKSVDLKNNMKAYCELGWYTFRRSSAKKKKRG